MVKDRIKKIFTSRIFYVAFSLLAAVSIWLYVSYMENPDIPQTVRVNVRMMNEEYLTDRGLVVTSINPEAVTLRFTGKRNIVTRLKNTNVTATVDLSMINEKSVRTLTSDVGTPLDISLSSFTLSKSVDNITVIVDNLVAEEIPVNGS